MGSPARDEIRFIYLSGARGINPNFLLPIGCWPSQQLADAPIRRIWIYGGNATAKNNNMTNGATGVAGSDTFDLRLVDRAKTKADSQGGRATDIPVLQP